MDPRQIDALAKLIGAGSSRRRVLKTLAGGAVAAVGGALRFGAADAKASKRGMGSVCSKHADCLSGACYPKDRTGRRTCGINHCTENQVVCKPLDECHLTGVCEPTTGVCSNPSTPEGGYCDRFSGTCRSGVCTLFPTLSCDAGSTCESQCPGSGDQFCYCGSTIEGDPVCYSADNGCPSSAFYCTSSGDCGAGSSCINLNGGCGGCDGLTGGKGVCNRRCTA